MIERAKWVSLFHLIGDKKKSIDHSVLATAIEKHALQCLDSHGRRVLATNGSVEDQHSISFALSLLRTYRCADDDHPIFTENSQLYKFGWPLNAQPAFSTINPNYVATQNSTALRNTTPESLVETWKDIARSIGKEVLIKHLNFSVDQIAKLVHAKMIARHQAGEKDMTGRGDKIPSADTIKRHALTGIKS